MKPIEELVDGQEVSAEDVALYLEAFHRDKSDWPKIVQCGKTIGIFWPNHSIFLRQKEGEPLLT